MTAPSYPAEFRPLATADLVRVGAAHDGGYVMPARIIPASDGLLSFGLSDEWEFEAAFHAAGGKPVICFDHTVDARFWLQKAVANAARGTARLDRRRLRRALRFADYRKFFDGERCRHIRKPLGYAGTGAIDLGEAMRVAGLEANILLKMDIEGWEYRALDAILAHADRFTGIAIEFHDVDLHAERMVRFIGEAGASLVLVHFHANSHTRYGRGGQSIVVEMTFMSRRLLSPGEVLCHRPLPIAGLDAPNLPGEHEAPVAFEAA